MIPYGRQDITKEDIQAVVDVLRSDFLTQGPTIPAFEKAVSEKMGARYALAVNSATSALHLACRALGVGEGDLVWTSPITFVASANCALYCGAEVDFVDIDPHTCHMSVRELEIKLEIAAKCGRLPKVVIPVHMCGQSCEMSAIAELTKRYHISVVEDASHAVGGYYRDDPVGSCRYSDITVFSFHPVKIITTAEGGMALTNHDNLFERMSLMRSHGITRDADLMTQVPDGPWFYQQIELGYNYRMTELQAALGLEQLKRLDAYVARRHELAARYQNKLCGLPVVLPVEPQHIYSALHLYPVRLQLDAMRQSRKEIFEKLIAAHVGVNVHYIPVHLQPYYRNLGFSPGDFPISEKYYQETLTLPLFPAMTFEQQDEVVASLKSALGG